MRSRFQVQGWRSKRKVADHYGVSPRTIDRWRLAGKFPMGTQSPTGLWYWHNNEIAEHDLRLIEKRGTPAAA